MSDDKLTPIPLWQSGLLFGIPGLLLLVGTYRGVPLLVAAGIPLIWSWTLVLIVGVTIPAIAITTWHLLSPGNDITTFKERFRFVPIRAGDWKWIAGAFFAIVLLNFAFEWTQPAMRRLFPQQSLLPEIYADPYAAVSGQTTAQTFFGWPMKGNFWLIPFWILWLAVLVPSEEILWRGYALPRMELAYGKWAFLVNGLLWNIPFHMYTYWNVFSDIPMYFIIPLVAMKTKSIYSSIILHMMLPLLALFHLIPGVLGR